MSTTKKNIESQIDELNNLLEWFESSDVTVEQAIKKYERAQQIAQSLQLELEKAKNKVEVIKKQYNKS